MKIPMLQLMPTTQEALIVDVAKETLELLWARVHNTVPHDDLCTMNPCNYEISIPEDRKFCFRRKRCPKVKSEL